MRNNPEQLRITQGCTPMCALHHHRRIMYHRGRTRGCAPTPSRQVEPVGIGGARHSLAPTGIFCKHKGTKKLLIHGRCAVRHNMPVENILHMLRFFEFFREMRIFASLIL
jgi:hypothetical protein